MGRYLEYDIASGRIICEVTAKKQPVETDGKSFIEVGEDENIDITRYIVRNGVILKGSETNKERQERQRLKREYGARCRSRLSSMIKEYVIAMLDEDENVQEKLRKEFQTIKRCL